MKKRDLIRGDKLRELILLVYLNDRYGLDKRLEVSRLKNFLDYSTGGLYNALDNSGYFVRKGDEIALSNRGETYARKELMRQYGAFHPFGYFMVFFGIILIGHWYLYKYQNMFLFFDWTVGFSFIIGGLIIRFALPALSFWFLKFLKKV